MNDRFFPRWLGALLLGALAASTAHAQLPGYSVVATPWMGADAAAPGTTRVHALAYLRNTEYFNPVEEGQTWFGTQLAVQRAWACLLYTSPSPRDRQKSRMPSSA